MNKTINNFNAKSKERNNHKIARCQFCNGDIMEGDNYFTTDGGCLGGIIYGHVDCGIIEGYSHKPYNKRKLQTYSGFQWAGEFESMVYPSRETMLALYARYGLVATNDCTVAVEFKTEIRHGLHGDKAFLEGICGVHDLISGTSNGTHANVSLTSWEDGVAMRMVKRYSNELFAPLARALLDSPDETKKHFGRFFGSYRTYTETGFEHGDWLRIKHNCLEFKLAKIQSPLQYFYLLCFLKEVCLTIEKYFLSSEDFDHMKQDAEKVGKMLVKRWVNHCNGKAAYYRAERNNKGKV